MIKKFEENVHQKGWKPRYIYMNRKFDFPMTPHVRLLVGRLFGLSICLKFQKREGNYTSMLLSDYLFSPYNR